MHGYEAWALEGGLDAWIEAGHPTEERFRDPQENHD
jgi:3-mercaptopyruvate sulfurtransferase SseA